MVARGSPYGCPRVPGVLWEAPGDPRRLFPRHAPSPAATADDQERPEANQRLRSFYSKIVVNFLISEIYVLKFSKPIFKILCCNFAYFLWNLDFLDIFPCRFSVRRRRNPGEPRRTPENPGELPESSELFILWSGELSGRAL